MNVVPKTRLRARLRRKRILIPVGTILTVFVVLVILRLTDLLVLVGPGGVSNSSTIPPCNPRTLAEGFTYHFRDPHRGELAVIHARGHLGGPITPDPKARDLNLTKRVIGIPGDTVVGRNGRVFVNGKKADDIPTAFFPPVHLAPKQYYVLGDNRSYSEDSRDFGPVPRSAIFARLILIYWPLGRFGTPGYNRKLIPPGHIAC
jgi:signal peptidase I